MTTKTALADVWGTLSRKVLASVLIDDGAVIPVNDIIGGHINWFPPKERPIWLAVRQCLDSNTLPTVEAVAARVNGHTEPGYIQAIAGLFNDDDNRHLIYHAQQLRELGVLASLRQLGRELSEFDSVEEVSQEVGRATSELSGLMACQGWQNL